MKWWTFIHSKIHNNLNPQSSDIKDRKDLYKTKQTSQKEKKLKLLINMGQYKKGVIRDSVQLTFF